MYTDYCPSNSHVERLNNICKGYNIVKANNEREAIKFAEDAEIILGHRYLRQVIPYAKKLKWVQSTGGGFDHLPWELLKENSISLTRVTFSSKIISQHAVMLALALNRRLPNCIDSQKRKIWDKTIYNQLYPRPRIALIIGLGSIGRAIAKVLQAMDIEVWGVKRKKDKESTKVTNRLFVDNTWINEIHKVDFCFLALPNTSSTSNILSEKVLNQMSNKVVIVNIARGELIDLPVLCRLLKEGKIGGAGLDVFNDRKPLEKDSVLWSTPNLIVTPYLSARYSDRGLDLEEYVESQVKKYFSGDVLENIVF
ncbi:NAD(P)-binding domain-containing protein [Mangrovimonas sp. AS39]|nr:NAD(P)-dependent oxidoreductase [Mangrovimonas futianensis]MCF1190820.1 NAD(P)-binding domain-containing protein [Mangrovimonas futianensis]